MTTRRTPWRLAVFGVASVCLLGVAAAQELANTGFRDVLNTAGLGADVLAPLAAKTEYDADDWQILAQLVYRLQQFPMAQLEQWATTSANQPGDLVSLSGVVKHVESAPTSVVLSEQSAMSSLYRCLLETEDGARVVVLVPQAPQHWQGRVITAEPVRLWGVALGATPAGEQLVVTNHLAWFPQSGVPTGWLLLARAGMDVALLDEVRHRQPFVKPDVSREGEAFYQALAAMAKVDPQELTKLTLANVAAVAKRFSETIPTAQERVAELRREISATEDAAQRESLQQQLAEARRELALAEAVERQGQERLSSVAPLFLQPEKQMGELVRIEGVARRAVRIAVTESAELPAGLDAYYELEVFTSDSQNLPVVCCVARLPADFPVGDAIHEPVRVDGVFFKSWRYRSRKNLPASGETGRSQQLYTPIVVGGEPRRLPTATSVDSRWGMWGGIAFLAVLAAIWVAMLSGAKQDRQRRLTAQPERLEDLPEGL